MDLEKLNVVLAWVAKVWGMGEVRRLLAMWFPPAKVARLAPPSAAETEEDDRLFYAKVRQSISENACHYRNAKGRWAQATANLAMLAMGMTY